jgi:hypothetical protein
LRLAVSLVLALGLVVGALSLAGCEQATEPDFFDRQFIPVGNWDGGFSDGYDIDNNTLRGYMAAFSEEYPATLLEGDIVAAVDFDKNEGVLIIKVTKVEELAYTLGWYAGVYYTDYTSESVKMGNATLNNVPVQKEFLNEALQVFTVGNRDDYYTFPGSYNRKK